jgi:hypothetical protein
MKKSLVTGLLAAGLSWGALAQSTAGTDMGLPLVAGVVLTAATAEASLPDSFADDARLDLRDGNPGATDAGQVAGKLEQLLERQLSQALAWPTESGDN